MPHDDEKNLLDQAEQFQRLFVVPLVVAVRAEVKVQFDQMQEHVKPIVSAIEDHGKRIGELEGSQKKALIGFGLYASIAAAAVGAGWGWIRSKFHWG